MYRLVVACALVVPVAAAAQPGTATTTGISRDFNPAISVNALFLGAGFTGLDIPADARATLETPGLHFQELELQFSADIDPYSKADVILAYEDGEFGVEEAFVHAHALPGGLGLRAGRMYVPLGIENPLHTHQLPFVQRSLAGSALFEETLADFGAELAYLVPLPFFMDVRGAVFDGDEAVFGAAGDWDLAYLGGVSALWDLTSDATFAVEAGYLAGRNGLGADTWTHVTSVGVDLKWRPARRARDRSLRLTGEFLYGERQADDPGDAVTTRGLYAYVLAQVSRRWWVQGRYDRADLSAGEDARRASAVLGFVPSEFQALRLQASHVDRPDDSYAELFLQYNFTIGSHPAHRY